MKKLAVIAFGGNALLRGGQKGTYKEQMENVTETCHSLLPFLKNDYNLVIGHGNGPQVGNVMLQHEAVTISLVCRACLSTSVWPRPRVLSAS